MTDLRTRRLFNPHLVDESMEASAVTALRSLADEIESGRLAVLEHAVGASPCRLKLDHRNDERFLFRVAIDIAANYGYVHDPTTQLEGLQECRTNAPAWDVTTPLPTATASAPTPAASALTSPSCRRSDDGSSRVKCAAPPADSKHSGNPRS